MKETLDKNPQVLEKLKNAYEVSTHNNNSFKQAVESVDWDNTFYADNEYYFVKGGWTN